MNYYTPNASELLEMSLVHFQQHAEELATKAPQMTPAQREAFLRICQSIAGMREAA